MANQTAIDQLFVRKPGSDVGDCYRCGEPLLATKVSAATSRRFHKMTGQSFPWPGISLNVEVDSRTLGATVRVSGRGTFCGDCAVAYMTEFNRLNHEMRAN